MVKIYNIQSNTLSKEDIEAIGAKMSKGEDVILFNEDIRYEIIDFDKMSAFKSKNYVKNIYALYIISKNIYKYIVKVFPWIATQALKLKRNK